MGLRNMLGAMKIVAQIVNDLIGIDASTPASYRVEIACEVLTTIGKALDQTNLGRTLMDQFCSRLGDLHCQCLPDGNFVQQERARSKVEDLLTLREDGWLWKSQMVV